MNSSQMWIALLASLGVIASAQTTPRKAAIIGGGGPGGGKCTVEVTVDGSAQVEVRGDTATLRNTGGQAPQWRRFECTGPMPSNPANFRFAGVDGRGRQTLARDPRNGGAAVVDIQDSEGGSEGYTFDLFWGDGPPVTGQRDDRPRGPERREPGREDRRDDRRDGRMTADQAMDLCRRSIQEQASQRFRTPNIDIQNVSVDNNPGRNDWIGGDIAIRRRFGRPDVYRFSCSVNFDTGALRSTHIDQFEQNSYPQNSNRRTDGDR